MLFYLQIQSSNVSSNLLNILEGPNTYLTFYGTSQIQKPIKRIYLNLTKYKQIFAKG
jgi:hypothetical protein